MRALLIVLFLTGCNHTAVRVNNAQPTAPLTGTATGAIAAAVLVTTAAVAATDELSNPPTPNTAMFSDWTARAVPPMEKNREIGEQDCTQPIDLTAGNLRCR